MAAYRSLAAGLAILTLVATLSIGQSNPPTIPDKAYLGHLSTDKPIYRVGERVYLRGVILGVLDHAPLPSNAEGFALLEVTGPHGEQLFNSYSQIEDSIAAFNWDVPSDAAGGQYTATICFPRNGYPPSERKFEVRAYRTPRLKGEIVFLRDGFGPGDIVRASLHVERAEGGLPVGAEVSANAMVDGEKAFAGQTKIDSAGNCSVEFALPGKIEHGDGTLSLAVADGGVVEPIAKTIPILLNTVDLSIYPEGGDLIAGLSCRVYFEARTIAKKPADIVGQVIDSQGNAVADLATVHEGRGRFTMTPVAGETYAIRLSQPSGITRTFPLPDVKADGVVIQSASEVTAGGEAVALNLAATTAGTYTVTLSKRQTEAASTRAVLAKDQLTQVILTPPTWADGVLVATVKKSDGMPVAERLIFRKSTETVHVKVTTNQSAYVPADPVIVTITTTDDFGKPVPAVVGLTAIDQTVPRMLEKRDRPPRLAEMVLLEDDVRDLADADVYFDAGNSNSALATDLLLGTQGWRRFAALDVDKFVAAYGDAARRALGIVQPVVYEFGGGGLGGGGIELGMVRSVAAPAGIAVQQERPAEAAQVQDQVVLNGALEDKDADVPIAAMLPDGLWNRQRVGAKMLPVVVRVYAHDLLPNRTAGDRNDFVETLYWAAGIKTDAVTGLATVSFKLNDSVTSFNITADAFDASGRLGEGSATITSSQPFYIEPKLPLEVSAGDEIHLPIAVVNGTQNTLRNVQISFTGGAGISVSSVNPFDLAPGQRLRQMVDVHIGAVSGTSNFVVRADAGLFSDEVTRQLVIQPLGFPTEIAKGGLVAANSKMIHLIQVPDSLVAGSVRTSAVLYPTPLANLTEALQRLLQEPNGCFEQTSSTTYPLVMADQYFTTHRGVDPTLISRSNDLLAAGYNRLVGFECQNKGFEWFGEDPGHECLTAYGLLEFTDMSAVRSVDRKMLADTRQWLLDRRDGKGGFTHERRSLHTWITDPGCANGYCTWALLETGQTGLDAEVKWLADDAAHESNSYVIALAANALFLAGDKTGARHFMDELAKLQDKDGHVLGATTSVVGSGGDSLEIETTSLATLAWLRDRAFSGNVELAIRYLAEACKAGRFGSTQSTVLALRAIVAYDKARAHPTAPGSVQLFIDNQSVGVAMPFDATTTGAIKLPDFSDKLSPGQHAVELRMTDGSDMPYSISVTFNSVTPASSDDCKLAMTTMLADQRVNEGAVTEAHVTVTNRGDDTLPTPIAIVGLPGGLEVRQDELKELVKADRIAAYEVRGRQVILYWRDIQPGQSIEIPLSLTAAIPGDYTGPASRTYLYYTDEFKQWQPGMKVTVVAR
jgi:alpha-2-macroglobulin-like protein